MNSNILLKYDQPDSKNIQIYIFKYQSDGTQKGCIHRHSWPEEGPQQTDRKRLS